MPPKHRLGGITTPRQPSPAPSMPQSAYRTPQGAPTEGETPHSYQMAMPAGASPLVNSLFGADCSPLPLLVFIICTRFSFDFKKRNIECFDCKPCTGMVGRSVLDQ